MFKKLSIIGMLCLFGCISPSPHMVPPDKIPPKPSYPITTPREIYQEEWRLISKDNWSFKVPNNFVEIAHNKELDVVLRSSNENIIVSFTTFPTSDDLLLYSSKYAKLFQILGGELLAAKKATINNNDIAILIFKRPHVGILHIISVDGKKAYHLDCIIKASHLEEAETCGKIVKSLEIKH